MEDTPFNVVQPTTVGDLTDVQDGREPIPAAQRVRVVINRVTDASNKLGTYKQMNVSFRLVNGIDAEGKYAGAMVFERICYFADPEAYTKEFFTSRKYLGQLKRLLKALGIEFKNVVIDDGFYTSLAGKELLVDIAQANGDYVMKDGTTVKQTVNVVRNFRMMPVEEQV